MYCFTASVLRALSREELLFKARGELRSFRNEQIAQDVLLIEPGDVVGLDLRVVGTLFLGDGFFRAVRRGGAVRLGDLGFRLVGVEHRVAYDVDLREDDVALIAEELEILRVLELDLLLERETHDLGRFGAERFAVGVVLLVVRIRLELHEDDVLDLVRGGHLGGHAENAVVLVELHGDREGAAVVGVIGVAGGLHIGVLRRVAAAAHEADGSVRLAVLHRDLVAHDARAAGAAGEGEAVGRVDAVLERRAVIHAGGGAAGVGLVIGFVVRIGGVRGRRRRRGRRGCRSDGVGRVADLLERIGAERHRAVVPDVVFQAV